MAKPYSTTSVISGLFYTHAKYDKKITKVHSRSLCTCGNRDNFRITESISKILGPEQSP